jgi:hypothetical protein
MEQPTKPVPQKKEYTRPVLTDHGTLARLTQSGSGNTFESSSGGGGMRPCL